MSFIDRLRNAMGRSVAPVREPLDATVQADLDGLASQLFNALRREALTWQERAIAAGDPEALLKPIDPGARWFRTVLVDDWPAYPVRVRDFDAWVIPGRAISDGYPPRAVYYPRFDYLRSRDAREQAHVDATVDALRRRSLPKPPANRLAALVVGHDNFAHVFLGTWNAMWRGRRHHGFRAIEIFHEYLAQSMGSCTEPELFPELEARTKPMSWRTRWRAEYDGTLLPIGVGRESVFDFHLDPDLRRAVRAVAARRRTPEADAIAGRLQGAGAVLWISVRGAGPRDAVNFLEWMEATVGAIAGRDPRTVIVFDGLSVQPGFTRRSVVRGEPTDAQIRRERTLVTSIMAGSPLAYEMLSGMPLYDVFYLSTFASFFLCHAGTLDHKIKWINPNLPGVVHGNLERHATYAWDPTNDIVRAQYLPARFIRDEKARARPDQAMRYAQYPYSVQPVDEAAEWVAEEFVRTLESVRVAARPGPSTVADRWHGAAPPG